MRKPLTWWAVPCEMLLGIPIISGQNYLQDLCTPDCSCPIHRALATVSSGDESPNYRALIAQLRKPLLINHLSSACI